MEKKTVFRKLFKPFYGKKSDEINFLESPDGHEFLGLLSKGNAGALFLALGKQSKVAEKIAIDLYVSNDETCKRVAAQLLGFIEDPKRNLFVNFYRSEKNYFDSLPADDCRKNNCHSVIEDLMISTVIQFDLKYLRYQNRRTPARMDSDWINCLFEIVSDAMNENQWNNFRSALSVLSFHFYKEKWFKVLLAKYEEYIRQQTDPKTQIDEDLWNEMNKRNGETEMFENFLNDTVIPIIDSAHNHVLSRDEESLVVRMINRG
ncbi:MAG: hypothetical protein LBE79_12855 [Tannerella sp.]|jgi:hypothetical protein|nr:hypothetical protein [Tannerella sp.]